MIFAPSWFPFLICRFPLDLLIKELSLKSCRSPVPSLTLEQSHTDRCVSSSHWVQRSVAKGTMGQRCSLVPSLVPVFLWDPGQMSVIDTLTYLCASELISHLFLMLREAFLTGRVAMAYILHVFPEVGPLDPHPQINCLSTFSQEHMGVNSRWIKRLEVDARLKNRNRNIYRMAERELGENV